MSPSAVLFAGLFFGALGLGYIAYGRKQLNAVAWLAGIGLCVFPFFVSDLWATLGIGAGLALLPFFFRRD